MSFEVKMTNVIHRYVPAVIYTAINNYGVWSKPHFNGKVSIELYLMIEHFNKNLWHVMVRINNLKPQKWFSQSEVQWDPITRPARN